MAFGTLNVVAGNFKKVTDSQFCGDDLVIDELLKQVAIA
jgi:hypothetical protein